MSLDDNKCGSAPNRRRLNPAQTAIVKGIALPPKLAARLLGLSPKTLANWRVKGLGPAFVKSPGLRGAVRYQLATLQSWQAAHERKSTSDRGGDRG